MACLLQHTMHSEIQRMLFHVWDISTEMNRGWAWDNTCIGVVDNMHM